MSSTSSMGYKGGVDSSTESQKRGGIAEADMNPLIACMIVALAGVALAEPPVSSGYSYSGPSGGGVSLGGLGGGYSLGGGGGGGGGYSHGGGGGGGGGGYSQVGTGYQTSEGASVDQALLEQIRQILLKEELQSQQSGGFGGGGYAPSSSYGAPSPQYGVPSPQYGVPNYQTRVVGVDLEGIRQAIQVAQFNQITQGPSFGGYPSGPSSSYGAPSKPSGSYGVPSY